MSRRWSPSRPFPGAAEAAPELRVLPNGVRVQILPEAGHPAVALGVWIEHGARFETPDEAGLAHLLEHMVFKGTRGYSVYGLAEAMDRFGEEVDAWTGREATAYSLEVLAEDAPAALDLLADMVVRPALPAAELERERDVVAAEAAMVREDPESRLWEELAQAAWPGSAAGRSVLGDPAVIAGTGAAALAEYHQRHYTGGRVLVAVGGDVAPEAVMEQVAASFGDLPAGDRPQTVVPELVPGADQMPAATEQAHIALCAPGPARTASERFTAGVANHLLGGSVTSRLFREVREKRGLAYAVYSDLDTLRDCGLWGIYLACAAEAREGTEALVTSILDEVVAAGFPEGEVERARHSLRAGLLRSGETLDQRLSQAAGDLLYHGRRIPLSERLAALDAVTPEAVQRVLGEAWGHRRQRSLVPGEAG